MLLTMSYQPTFSIKLKLCTRWELLLSVRGKQRSCYLLFFFSSSCYLDFRKICGIILITNYQSWGKIVSSASDFISSLTKSCCCPPEESNGHITSWSASVSSSFSCLTRFGQRVFFFVLSWWTDGSRMLQGLTNLLGCFHNWSLNN